jgi:hypothetical protein
MKTFQRILIEIQESEKQIKGFQDELNKIEKKSDFEHDYYILQVQELIMYQKSKINILKWVLQK